MHLETLIPGILGAFVGVIGWLFVGIYIQRRQFLRQARMAARAVYFELDVNRVALSVARDFGSFAPLDRTSFERLLPELAMLLTAPELKTLVSAYMAHAGYQQLSAGADPLPPEVRARALESILAAHEAALETLQRRAFSAEEARALTGPTQPPATASSARVSSAEADRRKAT
jgi:hypothetical protein